MECLPLSAPAYLIELEADAPWFSSRWLGELVLAQINELRHLGDFRLHAFVLLPGAYQAILTPQAECIQTVLQGIKQATKNRLLPLLGREVRWKGRVKAQIQDGWELLMLCGELHLEPVRAGLAADPEEYPFSSLVTLDIDEPELLGLTGECALG